MSSSNANSPKLYQLQGRGNRTNFGKFINLDFHGAPTYSQSLLMTAVGKALDAELSYTSDVFAFVVKELGDLLSPNVLKAGKDRSIATENGDFGMDIYYCRKMLEINRKRQANLEAIAYWNLHPGDKVKGYKHGLHKFATLTLIDTDDVEGTYTFDCTKRGTRNHWLLTLAANSSSFAAHMKGVQVPQLTVEKCGTILTATYDPSKGHIAEQRFSA